MIAMRSPAAAAEGAVLLAILFLGSTRLLGAEVDSTWDVGGEFRVRFEMKDNAGSFANRDFARNLENSNDFLLFRTKVHLGWSLTGWFSAYLEGRHAYAASDIRPITETDTLDLHQAYLRLGDPKQFPFSLKLADTTDFFYPESGSGRNQNGYGRNPGFSSHVGQEIDLLVDWRLDTWGLVRAGYGHFFVGNYIRNSVPENGGAVDADWVYLQTTLRF